MPDLFCLAARFPTLEAAGQAYTPIQELWRSREDTDLSVFRELSGVSIVAVVGIEPPAPVLEGIKEHLSLGELVNCPMRRRSGPWKGGTSGCGHKRDSPQYCVQSATEISSQSAEEMDVIHS